MGKMTFVVEYEDGNEPSVNAGTEILGGKLLSVGFDDYKDKKLTRDEINAINYALNFSEFREACEEFEVDYDELVDKLDSTL
ncbi:hypothetical protein [Proteus mirabilis]|uniref:hypothetical protein n=1 Tax=Proteus mirabilis TaxID=584 RepID=UPI0034D444DB